LNKTPKEENGMATRVLIVDDAVFTRNALKEILTKYGFEIAGEASNGVEGIEKYKHLKPDITAMDIVMPFKGGIQATRDILKQDPNALILACSTTNQQSLITEVIEAGAADFILKPFQSEDVARKINAALLNRR
jgi:two-component system chemotaxis response regulator CheY